jgi:hypothetical protein
MLKFARYCTVPALFGALACGSPNGISLVGGGGNGGAADPGTSGTSGSSAAGSIIVSGSDGGDMSSGGADTCGGTQLAAAPTAVNVLLVVDKSSSMQSTPTGFGDSKWNALRTALAAAIDATKGGVAFGLDFFPSSNDPSMPLPTACSLPSGGSPTVSVGSSSATSAAIKKALADNSPAGATPTAGALTRALEYFTKGAGSTLEGARYVLLATDGGPNCDTALTCLAASCTVNMDGICPANTNCCDPKLDPDGPSKCLDDDATTSVVAELAKANVKTFVVGIPGTEAYQTTLNALAVSGGATNPNAPPSYFAVTATGGVKALSQVLTNITTGLITSCDLQLSENPPDLEQINVVIDGKTIPEGSTDGWSLDKTTSPPTVMLKGATCQTVETTGAQQVEVTFGCPTVHVK